MGELLKEYVFSVEESLGTGSLLSATYTTERQVRALVLYVRNGDGQVVGGVTGGTYKNFARIQWLWTNHTADKSQLEDELMIRFEEQARARGCTFCFAEELERSHLPTYSRFGFTRIEGLPGFCRPDEPFGLIKHFDDIDDSHPVNKNSFIVDY